MRRASCRSVSVWREGSFQAATGLANWLNCGTNDLSVGSICARKSPIKLVVAFGSGICCPTPLSTINCAHHACCKEEDEMLARYDCTASMRIFVACKFAVLSKERM